MLLYSIIVFIAGVLLLVTSGIGMQRSNECEKYKKANEGNSALLTVSLITSLVMIIGSGVGFYFWMKVKSTAGGPTALAAPDVAKVATESALNIARRGVLPPIQRTPSGMAL